MRMSILLQREPFGEIVAATLSRFWSEQHGRDYRVRWHESNPGRRTADGQLWLVNAYLNAIFTPDVSRPVFDPIRREFSRSTVWWKRPLQRAYVALATAPLGARRLAQATLRVDPPVPRSQQKLVVAGNHKIRLLDRDAGVAHAVLKERFHPGFITREVAARRRARDCGVPVPPLVAVAAAGRRFSEQYLSGTPVNRLARPGDAQTAVRAMARHLARLHGETARREPLRAYVARKEAQIREALAGALPLPADRRHALLGQAGALVAALAATEQWRRDGDITTALTHGDFQPANVLVNDDGVWLIDWEYAARRQIAYDHLVYALAARFPEGLAERLQIFVQDGLGDEAWPRGAVEGRRPVRYLHACLFLLEEMDLHLKENGQPPFTQPGQGLLQIQKEIDRWLENGSLP